MVLCVQICELIFRLKVEEVIIIIINLLLININIMINNN
jgi:hypothetical protein